MEGCRDSHFRQGEQRSAVSTRIQLLGTVVATSLGCSLDRPPVAAAPPSSATITGIQGCVDELCKSQVYPDASSTCQLSRRALGRTVIEWFVRSETPPVGYALDIDFEYSTGDYDLIVRGGVRANGHTVGCCCDAEMGPQSRCDNIPTEGAVLPRTIWSAREHCVFVRDGRIRCTLPFRSDERLRPASCLSVALVHRGSRHVTDCTVVHWNTPPPTTATSTPITSTPPPSS